MLKYKGPLWHWIIIGTVLTGIFSIFVQMIIGLIFSFFPEGISIPFWVWWSIGGGCACAICVKQSHEDNN